MSFIGVGVLSNDKEVGSSQTTEAIQVVVDSSNTESTPAITESTTESSTESTSKISSEELSEDTECFSGELSTSDSTLATESVELVENTSKKIEVAESPSPNTTFSLSDVPEYSGSAYVEVNGDEPFFAESDLATESYLYLSPLDELGRCGYTMSCVSADNFPTYERGKIGQIKPSGWHTVKYPDVIEDLYLYNRCHLQMWAMWGDTVNVEENLITGTRYLNVEGMLPNEEVIVRYAENTSEHVIYRVTPIFVDNELICRGVLMEAESVESDGLSICRFAYNVQPNIVIDYSNGESCVEVSSEGAESSSEAFLGDIGVSSEETTSEGEYEAERGISGEVNESRSKETTYILNTNTRKFHYPSCSSVSDMKEKNKQEWVGSRDELINEGYEPCGRCNP